MKERKVTLGELIEALEERPELTVHFYEYVLEYPRTIKNISMIEGARIFIVASEQEEEAQLAEMTGTMLLEELQMHRNVYNTPNDTPVVVFDPVTATLHEELYLDLSILDRIDINGGE